MDKDKESYKKAGWLIKKGGARGEKHGSKRWFVLKAENLFYYTKEKDYPHQPKGGIDLHEAILIEPSFTKCEHGFQIVEVSGDEGRTYYLEPSNQKDKEEWCEVIRKELPSKMRGGTTQYRYRNIHCGYLTKRSSKDKGGGKWQKRFFVLQPEALLYYQQPSDHLPPEKSKGTIPLLNATITLDNVEKHPYAFQINCKDDGKGEGGRKYFLEPEPASQAFRDEWVQAIQLVLTSPDEAKALALGLNRQSRQSMGLTATSRPHSPISPISPKGVKGFNTSPVTSAPNSPRGEQKKSEVHNQSRSEPEHMPPTPKSASPLFVPPFLRSMSASSTGSTSTPPTNSKSISNMSPETTPPSSSRDLTADASPTPTPPMVTRALSSPGPTPPPTTRSIADPAPSSSSMIILSTPPPDPTPPPPGGSSLLQSLFNGIRSSTLRKSKLSVSAASGRPAPITTTPFPPRSEPTSPTTDGLSSEPHSPHTPTSRASSRPSSTNHSRSSSTSRSRPPSVSGRDNIPVIVEESPANSTTTSRSATPSPIVGSPLIPGSNSSFIMGPDFSSTFILSKKGELPIVPEQSAVVVEVLPRPSTPVSRSGLEQGSFVTRPSSGSFDGTNTPSSKSEPGSPTRNEGTDPSMPTTRPSSGSFGKSGGLTVAPTAPSKLGAPISPARKIIFPPIPITPRKTSGPSPPNPLGPPPPPPPLSHDAIATLAFMPPIPDDSPKTTTPSGLSVVVPTSAELRLIPPGPPPTPDSKLEHSASFTSSPLPPGPPPTPTSQLHSSQDSPFPPIETTPTPTPSEPLLPSSSSTRVAPLGVLPPSDPPPSSHTHPVPLATGDIPLPAGPPPPTTTGPRSASPFRLPTKTAVILDPDLLSSSSTTPSSAPPLP